MPITPDRFPGTREEDEIRLIEDIVDPVDDGAIRFVSGNFRAKDSSGVFNLRGGNGLTEVQHAQLDQLVHELSEDYFEEYTRVGLKVTNITVWTDATKNKKIREEQYSYVGNKVSQEVKIQYDSFGVEVERLTISYTYSGWRLISASAVRS